MIKLLENLNNYGVDLTEIMERFIFDEQLYSTCFEMFCNDNEIDKLEKTLYDKNFKQAFEIAHNLKGITGNLGLKPLFSKICILVEALRNNESTNIEAMYNTIKEEYAYLLKIANSNN